MLEITPLPSTIAPLHLQLHSIPFQSSPVHATIPIPPFQSTESKHPTGEADNYTIMVIMVATNFNGFFLKLAVWAVPSLVSLT